MAETSAQQPPGQQPRHPATVGDVMRPPLTTVDQNDHVAAAAYLMRHAGATALVVLDGQETNRPLGIITEADIVHTVADGKDVNEVRIRDVMTAGPTVVTAETSIPDAAETMTTGAFRHLPVVGDAGLSGIIDIRDVCRALLDLSAG
ncbi:MAG TPA: CBS domain-containing protein [Streptosporangiaceae bacterium]|nr:CBS domain-containing protein [Streptosporangiaceae bacterium]